MGRRQHRGLQRRLRRGHAGKWAVQHCVRWRHRRRWHAQPRGRLVDHGQRLLQQRVRPQHARQRRHQVPRSARARPRAALPVWPSAHRRTPAVPPALRSAAPPRQSAPRAWRWASPRQPPANARWLSVTAPSPRVSTAWPGVRRRRPTAPSRWLSACGWRRAATAASPSAPTPPRTAGGLGLVHVRRPIERRSRSSRSLPTSSGSASAGGFYLYTNADLSTGVALGPRRRLVGVALRRQRQGELPRRRRRGAARQAGAHPDPRVELQGPGHRHPPHGPDRAGLPRRLRPRRFPAADQHHRRRRRGPGRRPGARGAHAGTPSRRPRCCGPRSSSFVVKSSGCSRRGERDDSPGIWS